MTPNALPAEQPESEHLLRMANRVARVGGWIIALPTRHLRWSSEVATIHNIAPGRPVVLDDVISRYTPEAQATIRHALDQCAMHGTPFDFRAELQQPGGARWVRAIGEAVRDASGAITQLQGALQDITEQQRMELELARTAERLSNTLESISDAFFTLDETFRFTYTNHEAERLLQHSRSALLGRVVWDVFPAAVNTPFYHEYRRALRESVATEFEAFYPPFERWFLVKAYPVPDGLAVYFRDSTETRRANEQLRLLQSSVERLNDIVIITDAAPHSASGPRIVYVNQAFERLTGYTREEMIGRTPRILQGPRTDRRTLRRIRQALETWQPVREEVLNYTKRGDELWLELDIVPLADASGRYTHWVAVARDISERHRLEQQMLRAQRLESIGTLAGGIAHDLNNVLSPILMSVEMMQKQQTSPVDARRLEVIAQAAARGASMIQQVLGFARGIEGQRHALDVAPLLEETLRIVSETFPRNIGVHAEVAPGTGVILGDPTQLQQVLLNLCVNARDAMPDGGRLSVRALGLQVNAEDAARTLGAHVGPYVVITVEDSGAGIAPEHLEQIFDPFFTTKPVGEGTGLGLSTTLAIVKSHGGFLRVHSVPSEGTRVEVYLPAHPATSAPDARAPDADAPRGNGETVLVVDDEPAIRETTRQALEAHGYRVLEATDGADAIAMCAQHANTTRVAVIDLMMPVMDGVAAMQILQRLAPQVRIIAASGLAATREVRQAMSSGAREFLSKPYTASTLLHAIARVLGDDTTAPAPDTSQTIPPGS